LEVNVVFASFSIVIVVTVAFRAAVVVGVVEEVVVVVVMEMWTGLGVVGNIFCDSSASARGYDYFNTEDRTKRNCDFSSLVGIIIILKNHGMPGYNTPGKTSYLNKEKDQRHEVYQGALVNYYYMYFVINKDFLKTNHYVM
jgi:hypothetical protein